MSRLQRVSVALGGLVKAIVTGRGPAVDAVKADDLASAAIGDKKVPETISAHGGRILQRRALGDKRPGDWRWCLLCKALDAIQKDHCLKAAEMGQH